MENKPFHIDSNILANKKKSNKTVKKTNIKKTKKNKVFLIICVSIILLLIGLIFWLKIFSNDLIKNFSNGKILVCKDRLVSKELEYLYNKNENAFVNRKDGLIFSVYYCSNFDK